nr:unnamed protein product [Callosobruchus chinensis]
MRPYQQGRRPAKGEEIIGPFWISHGLRGVQEAAPDNDMDFIEYDQSLWLCLKCGNQACGRGRNKHALKHFDTPHSDSHALCVNTTVWSVWCYDCDDEVNISCKKNYRRLLNSSGSRQSPIRSNNNLVLLVYPE